jgi:hypothetical protein
MLQSDRSVEQRAQKRVARKYKLLGYDVLENPRADHLPDFLRDVTPDIVARSGSDNVVIEVKRHEALKGSNTLVRMAETVSSHDDWRLELVVVDDQQSDNGAGAVRDFRRIMDDVDLAVSVKLYDMAYIYLVDILMGLALRLVEAHKLKVRDIRGRGLFIDLGFKGVLPDEVVQRCLDAIDLRNEAAHNPGRPDAIGEHDLKDLLQLCEDLQQME